MEPLMLQPNMPYTSSSCAVHLPVSLVLELPWSDMEPLALKRWLWLPLSSDNVTILNKDWLWGKWLFYRPLITVLIL